MIDQKKVVCLPVEVFKREYESKLYLGLKLSKKGFHVVLGEHNSNFFREIKNSFVLYKDHAACSYEFFKKLKGNKSILAALDEEGIIYKSRQAYMRNRAEPKTLQLCDIVFLWGEEQKKLVENASGSTKPKLVVSGNPRFDIISLYKMKKKNQKSGVNSSTVKILVNTRFPTINGIRGENEIENLKSLGVIRNQKDLNDYKDHVKQDKQVYKEILCLVHELAKHEENLITIRPHPSEDVGAYSYLVDKYKNIVVDNVASLTKQIYSHSIVIHDGCTTAIEAAAMGVPVYGLRPKSVIYSYGRFPNSFSKNFESYIELSNFIATKMFNFDINSSEPSLIINNWPGRNGFSVDEIVKEILNLNIPTTILPSRKKTNTILESCKNLFYLILKNNPLLKKFFFNILKKRGVVFFQNRKVLENKFPEISYKTVYESLGSLCELDESLGSKEDYHIEMEGSRLFHLSLKER